MQPVGINATQRHLVTMVPVVSSRGDSKDLLSLTHPLTHSLSRLLLSACHVQERSYAKWKQKCSSRARGYLGDNTCTEAVTKIGPDRHQESATDDRWGKRSEEEEIGSGRCQQRDGTGLPFGHWDSVFAGRA